MDLSPGSGNGSAHNLKHPLHRIDFHGDEDAIAKFRQIKEERTKSTDGQRLPTVPQRLATVGQPPEVEVEVEVERKKNKTQGARSAPPVLPEWIDREIWDAYLDMRIKKRARATDHAQQLILNDLDQLRSQGQDPNAVLAESIKKSWTGVFPVKRASHDDTRAAHNDIWSTYVN